MMISKRKKTHEEIYKRKSSDGLEKECKQNYNYYIIINLIL